jgi:hypothetical protein
MPPEAHAILCQSACEAALLERVRDGLRAILAKQSFGKVTLILDGETLTGLKTRIEVDYSEQKIYKLA